MENALTKDDLKTLDELLSSTFNSILRIEERSLNNRLTEGLSIAELHTICAVGLHEAIHEGHCEPFGHHACNAHGHDQQA